MDEPKKNLQFELRAYTEINPCRLAFMLQELMQGPGSSVLFSTVEARWAELYPRHVGQTGDRSIRRRIRKALVNLNAAGIARAQGAAIVIVNPDRLGLAAANLAIAQDADGFALRPARWARCPVVPEHLKAIQAALEPGRLAAAARLKRS